MNDMTVTQKNTYVGRSITHESAHLHVSGKANYVDDIPEIEGTLYAGLGLAEIAHGKIINMDLSAVWQAEGVVSVLTGTELLHNNCGPVVADEPIIATDMVSFFGQVIFVVVAKTYQQAQQASRLAKVAYEALEPILTIEQAIARQSWILPPVQLTAGDANAKLAVAPYRLRGMAQVGGQEHFYLEGQICYAYPKEEDMLQVLCSTQHPTEMQLLISEAVGYGMHQVSVEVRRMGGGFGGKESQSAQWACITAILSVKLKRPVKLRLDRDTDMIVTGKRHGFAYQWDVGFDEQGMILGLYIQLASNCGSSTDLSGPVNDRAICHVDNGYYLDAVTIDSLRCKTNTVSNTAFRGFGGPQGMFPIEYIMDDIGYALDIDPLIIRQRNFYTAMSEQAGIDFSAENIDEIAPRSKTPYGTYVKDNILPDLVSKLAEHCDYFTRRETIKSFNEQSPIIKKGLALTPVKFGISFNATLFNQAGALVHIYTDGTILVNHGGTEMGQGLYSKIRQIVAHEFSLDLSKIRLSATDTAKVPNTSATAASSGTDLNGKAAQAACINIRNRLKTFAAELANTKPNQVQFKDGYIYASGQSWQFAEFIKLAYQARIQLWDSGFYKTPDIHWNPVLRYGRPFFYFAYGAAASEVAIDTLTGESKVLRVDILHDVGNSINPAIDIGQIEGGFIQGMGWLTSEELYWVPEGRKQGHLFTHAPSTYKIPTATDMPKIFNVNLYGNQNLENTIHRSKAVGEPPFMLALSVFSALREAVSANITTPILQNGIKVKPFLSAPATPEAILQAIVNAKQLVNSQTHLSNLSNQ
ncbi:xanthine dehydrogenase molybdopterin binding subunit (plasmid) [Moraxella osloensis]|uniref:Xanthine dehydrogenase molybdopterin binding subunit n=1 Tax=Faucicola osloensis TaxID=34062 RepID=A0AAD0EZ83_FAUOS|nr:xanthine dehydrogenase molybdopterin binding subunit [Moraxella osloensis]ATQ84323.1 xanthine dehydrogenase molybdopterin binding subunit [Moraxella osloensis]ATW86781.1 xanthine dehydrogenase molybdopterin binding subunit [Moraxella osloensis]